MGHGEMTGHHLSRNPGGFFLFSQGPNRYYQHTLVGLVRDFDSLAWSSKSGWLSQQPWSAPFGSETVG